MCLILPELKLGGNETSK